MAIANSKISSANARAKLPVSGKPLYVKLDTGVSLGYRKNVRGGVWVARLSDGTGGLRVKAIGAADDLAPANGVDVLSFPQAQTRVLAAKSEGGVKPRAAVTVATALDAYEDDRANAGGNTRIMSTLRRILKPLLERKLTELTVGEMSSWQRTLPGKAATINRQCASISAAFNQAAKDNDIVDRRAWGGKRGEGLERVARRGETARDRNIVLSDDVVRRLITAAYASDYHFGLLVDLSAVTGVRYSQLAACQVQDLQGSRLTVRQSKKGAPNKDRPPQVLEIGSGLADRVRSRAVGRPMTAPLLVKANGEPWRKSNHVDRFAQAVIAVGENPKIVSLYALRHTHITRQLLAGVSATAVAQLHETSIAEIEKHYARNLSSQFKQLPAPDYGPVPATAKVVNLRTA